MKNFVEKASSKISKLPESEILRIIERQQDELIRRDDILDFIDEGYILVSFSSDVLYMNETVRRLVPVYRKRKYIGQNIKNVILDSEVLSFILLCIQKQVAGVDKEFSFQNGTSANFIVVSSSKINREEKTILFNFRDITLIRKMKAQFRQNESLAAMTTMAAGVAHEIKNPLASISIYLQLLDKVLKKQGSVTEEEAQKYLTVVHEEIERLNSIAVDFLFAVRPMSVSLKLQDLNAIIKKTAGVVNAELQDKNIKLTLDLGAFLPKAMADEALIQQALLNLIKNSMQALDCRQDKEGKIKIHTALDRNNIKLIVSDNGCGMTEEQMDKIFEPYYTTKSSGTGLGLTVLFKILKEHGAEISVSSKIKEGSTFTITFPVPASERLRLT